MNTLALPHLATERYTLELATDSDDLHAAQRLRFEVFNLELHEGLPEAFLTGLDADRFDDVCDHLIVRESETQCVVGTYRLQTGTSAAAHHGYYSEREFRLDAFESARDHIVELGRACVAQDHRNQTVLGLLWRGIASYARSRHARYLLGCSSLTSQDESAGLATFRQLAIHHLASPEWRTSPQSEWRCHDLAPGSPALPIPRLLRAYLTIGARICGEPAIDREFSTIDFPTWLDLEAMPARAAQRFLT